MSESHGEDFGALPLEEETRFSNAVQHFVAMRDAYDAADPVEFEMSHLRRDVIRNFQNFNRLELTDQLERMDAARAVLDRDTTYRRIAILSEPASRFFAGLKNVMVAFKEYAEVDPEGFAHSETREKLVTSLAALADEDRIAEIEERKKK